MDGDEYTLFLLARYVYIFACSTEKYKLLSVISKNSERRCRLLVMEFVTGPFIESGNDICQYHSERKNQNRYYIHHLH